MAKKSTKSKDKRVSIPESEYKELLKQAYWGNCLDAFGVDNWEGYDEAVNEFLDRYPEEEDDDDDVEDDGDDDTRL